MQTIKKIQKQRTTTFQETPPLSGGLTINGLNGDMAVSGFELPTVWFPPVLSSGHRTQHRVQPPPSSIGGIFHREMENKSTGSMVPACPLLGSSDSPPGPSLTRFNWRYLAPWDGGKIQRSDDHEETGHHRTVGRHEHRTVGNRVPLGQRAVAACRQTQRDRSTERDTHSFTSHLNPLVFSGLCYKLFLGIDPSSSQQEF
jgi:hypothetical protein